MAKHHVIDFEKFFRRLTVGLRKTWEQARREHPNETYYLFGICTDSDITDLFPFSNTEEQYAATGNPKYPIDKWRVPDEAYEHRSKLTAGLADEVNRYVFEDHRKDSKGGLRRAKATAARNLRESAGATRRGRLFRRGRGTNTGSLED
jgi:hypothetical protein